MEAIVTHARKQRVVLVVMIATTHNHISLFFGG